MIQLCEVGPRDGLQNEKKILSTEKKVELITKLIACGIKKIEAVSFVNPKVVPQMADAEAVMAAVPKRDDITYAGLVLSRSGLERAANTSVHSLHVVTTLSDAFNLKNVRRTVDESVAELTKVVKDGITANKEVIAILGTAFGCPFSGAVPVQKVIEVAETFMEAGASGITLADTTGLANPLQVAKVVNVFRSRFGDGVRLGLHFHNTRGLGLANVFAGYQAGARIFDSSIAGLGGCPFAPKAVGNVCTEDMVNMFEQMNVATNTNLESLIDTARWLENEINRQLDGMMMKL